MMIRNALNKPAIKQQQGAILIVSLFMLILLTLIGVSAMKTTALEEKMAGNLRQQDFAFQAADSCATRALKEGENFTFNKSWETAGSNIAMGSVAANNEAKYSSQRRFRMSTAPQRKSGYSAIKFQAAHDEYSCMGNGPVNASVTLRQGVYQITPKL
ncbi:MAG: PilX N-terminal domain-containing pilus assembly protein [Methylococcaceae bacterium]